MDNIHVRLVCKNDIPNLAKIQVESWKDGFATILSNKSLENFTDLSRVEELLHSVFESGRAKLFIALLEGIPCGEAVWRDGKEELPGYAEIVALHSLRYSWGKGFGKAMMDKLVTDIKDSGINNVFLWVFKDNMRARRFYEKCGFITDGQEKVSIFDDVIEVRYIKKL